jgi:hypothetical protein
MPVASDSSKVDFSARIPRELYDEFRRYFPGYGATTWFINQSLHSFMEGIRGDPDAIERVQTSIDLMVRENRDGQ